MSIYVELFVPATLLNCFDILNNAPLLENLEIDFDADSSCDEPPAWDQSRVVVDPIINYLKLKRLHTMPL